MKKKELGGYSTRARHPSSRRSSAPELKNEEEGARHPSSRRSSAPELKNEEEGARQEACAAKIEEKDHAANVHEVHGNDDMDSCTIGKRGAQDQVQFASIGSLPRPAVAHGSKDHNRTFKEVLMKGMVCTAVC